jgi:hypothetical protein
MPAAETLFADGRRWSWEGFEMKFTKKTAVSLATVALGAATAMSLAPAANAAATPPPIVLGGGVACPVGTGFYDLSITIPVPVSAVWPTGFETQAVSSLDHVIHYSMTFTDVPSAGSKGVGTVTCYTPFHKFLFSYTDNTVNVDHPIIGDKFTQNITPS